MKSMRCTSLSPGNQVDGLPGVLSSIAQKLGWQFIERLNNTEAIRMFQGPGAQHLRVKSERFPYVLLKIRLRSEVFVQKI